jgi:Holliday junction resolvase
MNHDLVRVWCDGELGEVIETIRAANNNSLRGLPDVIAMFPDGRLVCREAKRSKKDRPSDKQHRMAKVLRQLYGDKLDLAIVEWDHRE